MNIVDNDKRNENKVDTNKGIQLDHLNLTVIEDNEIDDVVFMRDQVDYLIEGK